MADRSTARATAAATGTRPTSPAEAVGLALLTIEPNELYRMAVILRTARHLPSDQAAVAPRISHIFDQLHPLAVIGIEGVDPARLRDIAEELQQQYNGEAVEVPPLHEQIDFESLDKARIVHHISELAERIREENAELALAVDAARRLAVSWREIGEAAGVRAQSAHERWGKKTATPQ